jgi:hypothetical protein
MTRSGTRLDPLHPDHLETRSAISWALAGTQESAAIDLNQRTSTWPMCKVYMIWDFRMARVWITDGSLVPFSDVYRLKASHRGPLGLRAPYKGLIDPAVPVGSTLIPGLLPDDALCPEAEWCLQFPDGAGRYLSEPETINPATSIVMQGLIEGKWVNRLFGTDEWAPATLGNNLLAAGPGIRTTFANIERGAGGRVEVSYRYGTGGSARTQLQSSMLADLAGQNILGLARDVLRFCRDTGQTVDAIDLSAMGETAALFNERDRIRNAARFGLGAIPNPLYFMPRRRLNLVQKLVRNILADNLSVPPGAPVSITTYDQDGAIVGQGTLTWKREPAAGGMRTPQQTAAYANAAQ